ncbi:hypothetical protein [Flavobacterium lipolyticum]|uniref:Uncharacterized protein n=1 Tax=Flavobacterium lipolyticum TaxID=2893754 RepID=A0ABS8M4S3_9FLAO|nr:hypothetical protein [Flavobacterium sp. F-126]MCC9019792.1 hypothetical protein [Flavobacterium sp. F-126]
MRERDSLILELQNRILVLEKSNEIKSELNKLKSSTIQDLQIRTTSLENKNSEITYSDYISTFSLILSIITALSLVSYFFYKNYSKKRLKLRKYLSGKWGTEGDITSPQPLPYIDFEIEVDSEDGEITGIFNTNNENYPVVLSINGKLKHNSANIQITHISQQRLLIYGEAKLTVKGKLLEWKTKKGEIELFPIKAIAWKV